METREDAILEVNGEPITLRQALRYGWWRNEVGFLKGAMDAAIVRQVAAEKGIAVSDEDLQKAADCFRINRGLYRTEAMFEWLEENHLTPEDWEAYLEEWVAHCKLRDAIAEPKVDEYFATHRTAFECAAISHLVVESREVAEELCSQATEDGADFHALASRYSIDSKTRLGGGYLGAVPRRSLKPEMEAAVFGAQPGEVVGPLRTEMGWHLVRVEELRPAILDETCREAIKTLLFAEWMREQRARATFRDRVAEWLFAAE